MNSRDPDSHNQVVFMQIRVQDGRGGCRWEEEHRRREVKVCFVTHAFFCPPESLNEGCHIKKKTALSLNSTATYTLHNMKPHCDVAGGGGSYCNVLAVSVIYSVAV